MSDLENKIRVKACGQERLFPAGCTYKEIADAFQDQLPFPALLVRRDGSELSELRRRVYKDCSLEFVTLQEKIGRDTYRRSMLLMMLRAFRSVIPDPDAHVWIRFTVSDGLFCTLENADVPLDQALLDKVSAQMQDLVRRGIQIEKSSVKTGDAVDLFTRTRMKDKANLFKYRISSRTNIYTLDGYSDYFYGYMVYDTSVLGKFELKLYEDGFILMYPTLADPDSLPEFAPVHRLFQVQNMSRHWGQMMGISTVADLNRLIVEGKTRELVLMQEALQEKQIGDIAQQIAERKTVRLVLIAGPSSSSKTTFSHRLSTQLACHGLTPHPIAMDDYFVNREDTPKNPDGSYNFECLGAIDVKQFNEDMTALLEGKRVSLPTFNFVTGEREYKGKSMQAGEKDVLIVEGIHGLNEQFSYLIPAEKKFKIYISALTQLNIDEHNRIPTTDGRLLRRIVRDQRTRGTSALQTIRMWRSVRSGEEQNIFPFQESADVMFNSALIYELAVIKTYAVPMLHAVPRDCPEWVEAKRLLKFLEYFLPIPADDIPHNSLVREFIGGSIFEV